jgi:hypothetical protein
MKQLQGRELPTLGQPSISRSDSATLAKLSELIKENSRDAPILNQTDIANMRSDLGR